MIKPGNSIKVERFNRVLSLLERNQRVSLSELEQCLNVSRVTIQRDLVELEEHNLLKRFHGGAMSLKFSENLYDNRIRKTINVDVKKVIVEKALRLIEPGHFIGLDGSSTAFFLSEAVLPRNITAVTCNWDTFSNLSTNGMRAVLTGGMQRRETRSLVGPEAVATIRGFHFDLVFLSAEAYVPQKGFFDPYKDEIAVKQAFIESAVRNVMMLDASKVKPSGGQKICTAQNIDILITDKPHLRQLKSVFKDKLL